MTRIWFRIGRLAICGPFALRGLHELRTEQNVWRRFWLCFWWCYDQQYKLPIPPEADPEATGAKAVLHWVDPADKRPVCGASSRGAAWTIEWNYVSCQGCREKGLPRKLQYDFNTR